MYPVFQFEPSFDELKPDLNNIIQTMGYANGEIPDGYHEILMSLFHEAKDIVTLRGGFTVLPDGITQVLPGKIVLDNIPFDTKSIVSTPLKKMEKPALFVATIGSEFDTWSKHAFDNGDPLKGYMIDLLGSEFAESLADWINGKIIDYAESKGLSCSNRYSPGYCGWNVSEQHNLFRFLPESFCGISLTDSALMKPHKSVSGIVGMGSEIAYTEYPCDVCQVEHCYKNRRSD